jgi:hypothetical protein
MALYPEEFVLTPRDSVDQREVRSGYTGPKNNRGEPDTTGTDEIGVMNYPPNNVYERYSGQWKNGEPDGQGTLIYKRGDTYTGEFIDGARHGRGVYTHSNGMVREGEFRNGVNVRGTLIRPDYTFQGTFVNEKAHEGMFTYKDGSVFTGTIESATKRVGTFRYPDGDVFSGTFTADGVRWLLNGYGEMIVNSMPIKFSYRGKFRNNVRHGKGLMIVNGESYSARFDNDREIEGSRQMGDGEFVDDARVIGTLIRSDYTFQGTIANNEPYDGTFSYKDGSVFTGRIESATKRVGTFRYPDGDVFSGTFKDYKLDGDDAEMIVNSSYNKFIYKGQMRNGVRHGLGTMQIISGPEKGNHYSARFNMDQEVRKSRENLPKQGGTRHKRTRCRRKGLKKSKRDEKRC